MFDKPKKINFKFFSTVLVVMIILYTLFIYKEWLFSFSIITKGDWGFFFSETANTLRINYFSLWLSDFSFGRVLLDVAQAPTYSMYGFFAKFFNISYSVSERIIHLWPAIMITLASSFFCVKKIFRKNAPAIIGCIVYSFNTYILSLQTGHLTLMVSFALAPLIVLFFIKTLEEKSLVFGIITGLLSFISTAYEPRAFYIVAFVLFLYFLFHSFFIENPNKNGLLKNSAYAFLPILITLLLNFYWIFGLSKVGSLENNELFSRELFGNNFWNIIYSFTLHHPWWSDSGIKVFINQPIPFYFWFVPIVAFLGLILNLKNKKVIFWGGISLLGILLSKQVDAPFPNLYNWLYGHFPGFNAFREASKFYFLVALGYMVLIGSFIDWLWKSRSKEKIKVYIKFILTFLVAIIFLCNTEPILMNKIGTLFVPRYIPNDYLILKDYILKQPEYFRILWTPKDSRWGIYTDLHSKISNIDAIQSQWQIYSKNNQLLKQEQKIVSVFGDIFSEDLFDISSIKYVIIPTQDTINDDDFFIDYGGRENADIRQWYIDQLDKISWLKKINIGTKDLVVYENNNFKKPIFSFSNLINFNSLQNLNDKYNLAKKLKDGFYFASGSSTNSMPLIKINSLFEKSVLKNGTVIDYINNTLDKTKLYVNYDSTNLRKYLTLNDNKVSAGFISLGKAQNIFEYKNPKYTLENLILNGSFETGLWQEKVGDCNNFDKNPILGMGLNSEEKTNGKQSLQLEATRHIACTAIKINVVSGSTYQFSFDYQSQNSNLATYYIGFNDKNKSSIQETLPIKDKNWNAFLKTIKIPDGATIASLYVYAKSTGGITNVINRYDNFKMIQVPDLSNAYYLVSESEEKLIEPKYVSFDLINPTKKLVHIKGVTTPFFLAMSESYHPQWRLLFNNSKVNGFFNSWIPFVEPDTISNEYHYKLNDFLNAWYVDTDKYCKDNNLCTKSADGSYDIEMVIEFFPQRWFYLGLLISGTALIVCLGYLGYEGAKRIRIKIKK